MKSRWLLPVAMVSAGLVLLGCSTSGKPIIVSSPASSAPSSSASGRPAQTSATEEVSGSAAPFAQDPESLATTFLIGLTFYPSWKNCAGNDATPEQMKHNADLLWAYFDATQKQREVSLPNWEAQFAKISPYFQTGEQPKFTADTLNSFPSAETSHAEVVAVANDIGRDSSYQISIAEQFEGNQWYVTGFQTTALTSPVTGIGCYGA
jgi:hypothetical protein